MPADHCGNPLLRDWVKEWMDHAQGLPGNKSYYTYKKAYESLSRCPEVFSHPSQATTLDGIGPGIVKRFETNMQKYCKENNLPMPERPTKARKKAANSSSGGDEEDTTTPVRQRKPKTYIPVYRSGGYGVLLCLLDIHDIGRENASKDQICRSAQGHCDASYTMPDAGKTYTAWSSMKTLCDKGYVWKNGSPAKYCLTDTGVEIARQIKASIPGAANGNGSSASSSSRPTPAANNIDDDTMYRNPSTARSSSARSSMIDFNDDTLPGLDMSLYVSDPSAPSAHQSISINGRTSNNNSPTAASRENSSDILQSLADASRPKKRQRATNANGGNKRQRASNSKEGPSTASVFDKLIAEMADKSTGLDMNQYVMNPSEHQTISLGNQTVHSKPPTPIPTPTPRATSATSTNTARSNGSPYVNNNNNSPRATSSSASSVTISSRTSFAQRVVSSEDNDDYENWYKKSPSPVNSQKYSTPPRSTILQADNARKYTTPASSVLLKNNNKTTNNKSSSGKPQYNVDEYDIDMTLSSLPNFKQSSVSSQLNIQSEDIVDLLSSSPSPSPELLPAKDLNDIPPFDDEFDTEKDYFPLSQQRTKQINDDTFHYTYLDSHGEEVRHLSKSVVIVDEINECLAYQIRFFSNQSEHPKYKHVVQVTQDEDHPGCSTGYIPEIYKDMIAPGLPAKPVLPLHREEPDNFWPSNEKSTTNSNNNNQTLRNHDYSERIFSSQASSQPSSQQQQQVYGQTQTQTQTQTQQQKEVDYAQLVENERLEKVLLPHEYEIVLVLDSREIQMQSDRDYFQRKLTDKGIKLVTRSMDLGDVIWIARKIGSTNQTDELYLDFIVERKRLDDLVSSIKDGRFVEQKTRLKRSGSAKVIYVVEEYNRDDAYNFGTQAIQTAMSSTQIIDGIYLKRTNSIDETIAYLVSATKLITRIYKDTTLYAIPDHIITRQNYLKLKEAYRTKAASNVINNKSAYLINYPMFGELNTKSGTTTLHEVYLRMLMTIKGVNAERALSLMKIYPTPHALLKAFDGKTGEEAKNMVKDATAHHISRRRWGIQISDKLFQIWGASDYPAAATQNDDE